MTRMTDAERDGAFSMTERLHQRIMQIAAYDRLLELWQKPAEKACDQWMLNSSHLHKVRQIIAESLATWRDEYAHVPEFGGEEYTPIVSLRPSFTRSAIMVDYPPSLQALGNGRAPVRMSRGVLTDDDLASMVMAALNADRGGA